MNISNSRVQQLLQKHKSLPPSDNSPKKKEREALNSSRTLDKAELQTKRLEQFKISKNSPKDPAVSKKVLDSLQSGIINFSQKQRDTLAEILDLRSKEIIKKRALN